MMDQVKNLQDNGISGVDTLNGMRSITERADILDRIALGDIGILFVAPEQFRNTSFLTAIKQRQINGFVFDEAHCLSKWGHDFRPDYRYAAKYIKEHHSGNLPAISCFTATAKPDVLDEIRTHFAETLGITFHEYLGGHERDNLAYEVLQTAHGEKKHRIHELLQRELGHQDGGAVVFVARRKSAETISEYLKQQNWACAHYHAGLGANEKADIQQRFIDGELRVIVATNAFGMGVDKKTCVRSSTPKSPAHSKTTCKRRDAPDATSSTPAASSSTTRTTSTPSSPSTNTTSWSGATCNTSGKNCATWTTATATGTTSSSPAANSCAAAAAT